MSQLDATIVHGTLSRFKDELDDWCGTKPPRKFPPKGPGVRDVLVAIAIHDLAEQISDPKARGESRAWPEMSSRTADAVLVIEQIQPLFSAQK